MTDCSDKLLTGKQAILDYLQMSDKFVLFYTYVTPSLHNNMRKSLLPFENMNKS
jgi:hypothetical protein